MTRINEERRRQQSVEGYSVRSDSQHYSRGELLRAANCYLHAEDIPEGSMPAEWPWDSLSWKPTTRGRNLEKAGALYLAEADRRYREVMSQSAVQEAVDKATAVAKELDGL